MVRALAGGVAAALVSAALLLPALAPAGDDEVRSPGRCTGAATTRISVGKDGGRLVVTFKIDGRRRQRWKVVLRRDGNVVARTTARTRGPKAILTVRRRISNSRGSDAIKARGRSSTGQICRASISIA